MPRNEDGSISGIDPFYTEEAEDTTDWDDVRKFRKEQEILKEQEKKDGDKRAGESQEKR